MRLRPPRRAAIAFGLVLAVYLAFRIASAPIEVEGVVKLALWFAPCVLLLLVTGRKTDDLSAELGLSSGAVAGYGFGLLAALPTVVALPFSGPVQLSAVALLNGVILGPFAEEVLFRGFLMRQLMRARWRPVLAAVASAFAFGLAHLGNVDLHSWRGPVNGIIEVAMTTGGGLLLGWIVLEWGRLWPAIGLHSFMNLSWQIFGVNDLTGASQAGAATSGSAIANSARMATIVIAIALTLLRSRALARTQKRVIHTFTHSPFTH